MSAPSDQDLESKYLYALAEVENTRRRMARAADEATHDVKRRILRKFLPILDNLERALAFPDSEELRAGLAATVRSFESTLASEGVTPMQTTGRRFDPSVAEAIATQPADDVEDETILAEAERGYLVDDDVLRPARVVVAKRA